MKLGNQIKILRNREGLTQAELAERTGLTTRTIQRIENHDVEPSAHSLKKIGEVLHENLNEQKTNDMKRKQQILNFVLIAITLLIAIEFLTGILTWQNHWWVALAWSVALFGGVSLPYYKRKRQAGK